MLRRRRRFVRLLAAGLAVTAMGGGAVAYGLYRHLDGNIASADISGQLGTDRPAEEAGGAEDVLVIGSDSRDGLGTQYGAGLTTAQSDTMLLVHLSADRQWAAAVSIPRDSWVSIPSCTGSDGTTTTPRTAKINEAFALGSAHGGTASGAACATKTVEAATGVRVDHVVVVDFAGFKAMTTALGGVPVCTTEPVVDPDADLDLPAGEHLLEGEQALGFVRTRHAIGDGSDLGRIGRQQQFLASMARTAESKLTDPAALYRFLEAATSSVTTDSGLGSLTALAALAQSVSSKDPAHLQFFTVPNHPRGDVVKSDRANVLWSEPAAGALFSDLEHDVDPTTPSAAPAPAPSATASASATPAATTAPAVPATTGADTACTPT